MLTGSHLQFYDGGKTESQGKIENIEGINPDAIMRKE
jgi:hypothetical protein